jgi:pimeloyl-ACP methyl ester carboxylesterase
MNGSRITGSAQAILLGILVFAVTSCTTAPQPDFDALQVQRIDSGPFSLLVAGNGQPPGDNLHIYLGSDGIPWQQKTPSPDPTGSQAIALNLLRGDPARAFYLGRPCYHLDAPNPACEPGLWTSGRYGETVLSAMGDALTRLLRQEGPRNVTLIGYSGGGVLAVLLAQRHSAVNRVITIAAPLDTAGWTDSLGLQPLDGSINPADVTVRRPLEELHFRGAADRVVPPSSTARYFAGHPQAQVMDVAGFDHRCCWSASWLQQAIPSDTPQQQ